MVWVPVFGLSVINKVLTVYHANIRHSCRDWYEWRQ